MNVFLTQRTLVQIVRKKIWWRKCNTVHWFPVTNDDMMCVSQRLCPLQSGCDSELFVQRGRGLHQQPLESHPHPGLKDV